MGKVYDEKTFESKGGGIVYLLMQILAVDFLF
jgi:hypothetical protein